MLFFLKVAGFAIIDEIQVEFEEGLNVITGETGAGKSIIINALATLINPRVSQDMVKSGSKGAEIVGYFLSKGEEYIVKRTISPSGRSRIFLNEEPITMNRLEELGTSLVNIYGQNEFQHLLEKKHYIQMIDRMFGLEKSREDLSEKVRELKALNATLEVKKRELKGREQEMELLQFQIKEIEEASIKEGEEEDIRERLKTLKEADRIRHTVKTMADGLYEGDGAVYDVLKDFIGQLKNMGSIKMMDDLRRKAETISYMIEDIVMDIKGIEKEIDVDPDEMNRLEERISNIYSIKEKYGKRISEIEVFCEKAKSRLNYLNSLAEETGMIEKKREHLAKEVYHLALVLSEQRRNRAPTIEKKIAEELGLLSMEGIDFKVHITDKGDVDEDGMDDVDLLITTNPGEPLRPLRKIASGGELSRIMLAIKKVMGDQEDRVLIFDEIDSGIGGKVADVVGMRLKEISRNHQVFCITHLPQIAAYGDHHFLVEKIKGEDRTKTLVKRLEKKERVMEIARMLGGVTITEKTIKRAEEMLEYAEKSKD